MKTPITRRLFFWTLFVSYFCITGTVLFFVFGYEHDFGQKIFVHTGSLTIKTNPKSISIKIDDKEPKSRLVNVINDSYFIMGLRPKKHTLSIFSNEFKPWRKEISIHSGISTEFWNILLLRKNYERTHFTLDNIDHFFPAPDENMFASTHQLGKTLVVHVFNTKEDRSTNTFIFPQATFTKNEYENIEWSPDNNQLLTPIIHTDADGKERKDYIVSYLASNESYQLSNFIDETNLKSVRWDPEEKNAIYFIAQNTLFYTKLTFADDVLEPAIIAKNVINYDFADDGIYIFNTQKELLYNHDKKATDFEVLTIFDTTIKSNDYRLIAYDNHRSVLIDDMERVLHIYNEGDDGVYTKKISKNIVGAHFSDDGKKLIFYSPFEIFLYFTRKWDTQPVRTEDKMQSIIRFSQKLDNVHFAKNYEHVIYTIGNDIKITELDYRGSRITDTIISLNEKETTVINKHKMNRLFFIDSTDNSKRQLQSIVFPEKETLF
ncbi:MAG TPA: hypothetical protein EYG99_00780 [Candidatus Pacebacteria bacterium]|nr:hypothetical protein [Candidatus Paceibacterota bacterium]